ncbi:cytochrome P450 [Aspergillus alliaceus]|uniref:Cytochrome P450 n=1 Tax=Petromyces alliaceus TaxID=209559 RepID=A0A5N7CGY8_PETAA|nr:cytochrome P450 [Aspergillus alliaceus]
MAVQLPNYLVVGAMILAAWVLGTWIYNTFMHPLRGIPGPFLARMSHLWLFAQERKATPHKHILELHKEYGPIMRISPNEISFTDIEASDVIYAQTSRFEKSKYYYQAFETPAKNLFSMQDRREHSQDKKLISHSMSRANIILHESSLYDKANFVMDRVAKRAMSGQTVPLFLLFRCMTLDMISDFAFGKSTGASKIENFESSTFDAIDKANSTVPLFQHFPVIHQIIQWATYYGISRLPHGIRKLTQAAEAGFNDMESAGSWTMFKNMISAAEKSTRLTKEHLIAEGMLMIVAGTDTTATSLSVTLHNLLQQPEIYKKLQDEARTVLPTLDSRPPFQELDALPLLDACIKEGLRISSPVQSRLPRTVEVSTSPLYFHYNEDVFPSPTVYTPSRWLVEGQQKSKMLSYFHPFSRGTRQCIGRNLSLIEQKIVLAMFVRRFDPREVLNRTVNLAEAVTAVPEGPMEVRVQLAA